MPMIIGAACFAAGVILGAALWAAGVAYLNEAPHPIPEPDDEP